MNFNPIDFSRFNKPPFFPQYLARGETKKLVSFDDSQLAELDRLINRESDQYDLDKIRGILMDRLGSLLDEPRNGNPDELYRLFLRLRTMLNTTNGTINDVIKVIKHLYSSEVVHIVPDYPAGIIILHDGEGPNINFNNIIKQVVGAGIDYSTKELFYFTEEAEPNESVSALKSATAMADYLGTVFRNGMVQRNGVYRRRYTGVNDVLAIILKPEVQERIYGMTLHNGLFRRNGEITRSGFIRTLNPATEILAFSFTANYSEQTPSSESADITLFKEIIEIVEHEQRRNGAFRRNGAVQRTNRVYDQIAVTVQSVHDERQYGSTRRNGVIRRDGSERRSGFTGSPNPATEKSVATIMNGYSETAQTGEGFAITNMGHDIEESVEKNLRRNRTFSRNGQYSRGGISEIQAGGVATMVFEDAITTTETFAIGRRGNFRFRNGAFRRNGQIKRDANILIPLE